MTYTPGHTHTHPDPMVQRGRDRLARATQRQPTIARPTLDDPHALDAARRIAAIEAHTQRANAFAQQHGITNAMTEALARNMRWDPTTQRFHPSAAHAAIDADTFTRWQTTESDADADRGGHDADV